VEAPGKGGPAPTPRQGRRSADDGRLDVVLLGAATAVTTPARGEKVERRWQPRRHAIWDQNH
jgi:hypothetical protein